MLSDFDFFSEDSEPDAELEAFVDLLLEDLVDPKAALIISHSKDPAQRSYELVLNTEKLNIGIPTTQRFLRCKFS